MSHDTRFVHTRECCMPITADGDLLNLDFAGNQLVVPAFLKGCLATITSGLPFKVGNGRPLIGDRQNRTGAEIRPRRISHYLRLTSCRSTVLRLSLITEVQKGSAHNRGCGPLLMITSAHFCAEDYRTAFPVLFRRTWYSAIATSPIVTRDSGPGSGVSPSTVIAVRIVFSLTGEPSY